jgi:hypothetical protein
VYFIEVKVNEMHFFPHSSFILSVNDVSKQRISSGRQAVVSNELVCTLWWSFWTANECESMGRRVGSRRKIWISRLVTNTTTVIKSFVPVIVT